MRYLRPVRRRNPRVGDPFPKAPTRKAPLAVTVVFRRGKEFGGAASVLSHAPAAYVPPVSTPGHSGPIFVSDPFSTAVNVGATPQVIG